MKNFIDHCLILIVVLIGIFQEDFYFGVFHLNDDLKKTYFFWVSLNRIYLEGASEYQLEELLRRVSAYFKTSSGSLSDEYPTLTKN